jgi:hypothetical protein
MYHSKKESLQAAMRPSDVVLDIGFSGQGITDSNAQWPHRILKVIAHDVYGVDLDLPQPSDHYLQASAKWSWRSTSSILRLPAYL